MASAVAFTGGKDSMLALHLAAGHNHHKLIPSLQPCFPVTLLVTFAPAGASFKAHPLPVIEALATALGIPHMLCEVNSPFLASYQQHVRRLNQQHGITQLVTGDILDVASGFMEAAVQGSGVQLHRPLWHIPRQRLLQAMHDIGIRSRISCVDLGKYKLGDTTGTQGQHAQPLAQHPVQEQQQQSLAQSGSLVDCGSEASKDVFDPVRCLLGQELTPQLVAGPLTVAAELFGADLAGEGGEYHTLVFDAPMMSTPLVLTPIEHKVTQDGAYAHAYVAWQLPSKTG